MCSSFAFPFLCHRTLCEEKSFLLIRKAEVKCDNPFLINPSLSYLYKKYEIIADTSYAPGICQALDMHVSDCHSTLLSNYYHCVPGEERNLGRIK